MFRLALLLWLLTSPAQAFAGEVVVIDDFESGLRDLWQARSFSGETRYSVVTDGEGHCLRAESLGSASGLSYAIDYDLNDYPVLSWRWKVANVLAGGDARRKEGDDYAARVYVIFPHWFFPKTRTLNYIWANRLPRGEAVANPYTGNARMVAVESGDERVGEWVIERRNVLEDYRRIFGGEPPAVGAIAVMTDTDNTGGSAVACYDDIRIERP